MQGLAPASGAIFGRWHIELVCHSDLGEADYHSSSIRDKFAPSQTQKVISQVAIYFAIDPTIAPIMGGWLFVLAGGHSIFWFLAVIGVALWVANYQLLPETLHATQPQPFNARNLLRGYWQLGLNPRCVSGCWHGWFCCGAGHRWDAQACVGRWKSRISAGGS